MSATTILLSGGNTGIGYEIAKRLVTTHPNLVLFLGSRTLTNGETAASTLQSLPTFHSTNTIHPIQLDLTSDSSITSCISTLTTSTPHLDVLINNAGIAPIAGDDSPAALRTAFNSAFDTNVSGTAVLTDACIPLLSASPNIPRVIFITSGLSSLARVSAMGKQGVAPQTHSPPQDPNAANSSARTLAQGATRTATISYRPYVVSKTAMNMLAVSYSLQFHEEGWKVNLVCPGLRKTKLNDFHERAGDPALGALEAVGLAMDGSKVVEWAKDKEVGKAGGMWDWDGTAVKW